ncbi:MAG: glycosyltransferase [Kiloniellales bacterium]
MAKVLILTLGSRGDVQPYVALGAALMARGHQVTLSTGQGFDDLIAAYGLSPAALSVDMQALVATPEVLAAMTSLTGWLRAFRSTQTLMQRQLDDLWRVAREQAPDVIVYHPKAFIAPYLARALGAVALASFLQPAFVATSSFPNALVRLPDVGPLGNKLSSQAMIAAMRLGYGSLLRKWLPRHSEVAAHPRLDVLRGYHPKGRRVPRLHAHSGWLVPKPSDWAAEDQVTGGWFLARSSEWQPPAELAAFLAAGPPPVYVGFGSMPAVDAERIATVVFDALKRTKTRAILAKGWGALAKAAPGEDIQVVESVPHDWLFPKCRAVVHHGGAGTTHAGLRWGCPTLVCPLFGDQAFWGRVVKRVGAGPAAIPLKRLSLNSLSTALLDLRSPSFRSRAAVLSEQIRSEDGVTTAADLVEAAWSDRDLPVSGTAAS